MIPVPRPVVRPWIGARTQALTGEMARSLGLPSPQGVMVADIWAGGPAARAGIDQGDVIISVDGQAVNDPASLNYRVGTRRAGDSLALSVRHAGAAPRNVSVRVEAPPSSPAPDERTLTPFTPQFFKPKIYGITLVVLCVAVFGTLLIARSVIVAIVSDGLAPTLAGTAEPSQTRRFW